MNKKEAEFERIWNEAYEAGMNAGKGTTPPAMIVSQHENPLNDNSPVQRAWFVPEGPCGFAWVVVRPGNSAFARWAKKVKGARTEYGGGMNVYWVREFNQSITRKEAFAAAFAGVLQKYGIKAYSNSRMD